MSTFCLFGILSVDILSVRHFVLSIFCLSDIMSVDILSVDILSYNHEICMYMKERNRFIQFEIYVHSKCINLIPYGQSRAQSIQVRNKLLWSTKKYYNFVQKILWFWYFYLFIFYYLFFLNTWTTFSVALRTYSTEVHLQTLTKAYTEKSFRNLIKSNRNQIVFIIFRLIWKQKEISNGSQLIGKWYTQSDLGLI